MLQKIDTANPFPSQMGRVCPAPCQSGCNRNEVDDYVGINAVEQFIGDNAIKENYKFEEAPKLLKHKVAIIGLDRLVYLQHFSSGRWVMVQLF